MNSNAAYRPPDSAISLLVRIGLMKQLQGERSHDITRLGYEFMLEAVHMQVDPLLSSHLYDFCSFFFVLFFCSFFN